MEQSRISSHVAVAQARPRVRAVPWALLLSYLLLAVAALLPRVLDLGLFVNGDEANYWIKRSNLFLTALRDRDFGATAISRHPGVTTMWLGSAGILLRRALLEWGLVQDQGYSTMLALMRLPVALAHVVGILLGYGVLRRLLPPATALLAAWLWATDPFVIAYSRLLHVDGLAATFATLSLLLACYGWHHVRRKRWLVLSAVCAGLALLSKSPALILFPITGLVALAAAWREPGTGARFVRAAPAFGLWCAVCIATAVLFWPALWAAPVESFDLLRAGVEGEGLAEHQGGNFFLGRVDDRPGLLFYPVALAMRLTPWTLLGILASAWAWGQAEPERRHDLAALALYSVLFVVAMSLFTKKLNRYLVPIFPAIDILAAAGLVALAQSLGSLGRWEARTRRMLGGRLAAVALSTVGLVALANAAFWHPYGILAFNQLFGGARGGANTFGVGSGEGLSEAADWLNQQPDITGVITISSLASSMAPFMRPGAQVLDDVRNAPKLPEKTGYLVVYIRRVQQTPLWSPLDQFYGKVPPLHVVRLHGVEYVWIYQVPPPVKQPLEATFGRSIRLRGFDIGTPRRGAALPVRLFWTGAADVTGFPSVFVHLIGPDGERYAQVDLPEVTRGLGPGRYRSTDVPLVVPAGAPAGTYQVAVGLYDPATGQRLPLAGAPAVDPALAGAAALRLTTLELE